MSSFVSSHLVALSTHFVLTPMSSDLAVSVFGSFHFGYAFYYGLLCKGDFEVSGFPMYASR